MPFGVYLGYTSRSDSVLEPGGAYPTSELSAREKNNQSVLRHQFTHVNHFALKYDEHQALNPKAQRDLPIPKSSVLQEGRTLYAHSAIGRPRNADRTSQPDGASALGCTKAPAARRALVAARGERNDREREPELAPECAKLWPGVQCLALRRRA